MTRLVTCWNLAPAASQLCSMGSRAAVSTALRATLSRQVRRAPAVGVRSFTSKPRVNNGANYARLVPVAAASTGLALSYYLYHRGPAPARMDLTPPKCHNCVDENVPKEEKGGDYCSMEGRGLDCCSKTEGSIAMVPAIGGDPNVQVFEPVTENGVQLADLPVENAILTTAPHVPPAITRDHPALVKVPLVTTTKLAQLTSQYKYEQWTFNGTVPGPFIRAKVGDVVELSLTNKDPAGNPHNIDCHAFTGPGGGAAVTTAEENETKTARFKLLYPGLYVYHCAAAPVPVHIANGMYGLMYVQPEGEDLPPVDKEYYVMQSEFYHEPPEVDDDGRRSEIVEFSYPNGLREEPQVVAFNGSESALTRDKPLKANVGDNVRIFFGNAGPNLTSSFHIIGSHFKNVYRDGGVLNPPSQGIQTVSVPSGGSTIVDLKMAVPGTYTLVDHAIFRLDKGAVGFLNVSGPPNPAVYQSPQPPRPCVGCKLHA
ncbi:copper-containing nitrite reductase [Fusarium solani]|uniref:Copper-containing nitrite reductase n=1 Tax=Fusarium solani TaxID=169388 RepID=A0A9P9HCA3_FUSSL|nr:copper-containing nitrite reductase [Fusarium solani]KAH7254980.1 copper-containing nitrite reductase [Fusarium solani]